MQDNGVVHVSEGNYAERPVISRPVRLIGDNAVIIPSGGNEAVLIQSAHNVTISGIIVDAVNSWRGISISHSHDITIDDCEVKNCYGQVSGQYGQGIIVSQDNDCWNIKIYRTHVHHVGGVVGQEEFCHCIYASVPGLEIGWCELDHSSGNGLHIHGQGDVDIVVDGIPITTKCNAKVFSTYFHDNSIGGGIYVGDGEFSNNVFRDNGVAMAARYNAEIVKFYHNTAVQTSPDNTIGLDVKNLFLSSSLITAQNNVFDNLDRAVDVNSTNGTISATSNLRSRANQADNAIGGNVVVLSIDATFAPFTDDSAAQIKPMVGNPAIGEGVDVGITTDYGGNVRNNPPTIGAWEPC